jgi:para-nitrobenzyl esterase
MRHDIWQGDRWLSAVLLALAAAAGIRGGAAAVAAAATSAVPATPATSAAPATVATSVAPAAQATTGGQAAAAAPAKARIDSGVLAGVDRDGVLVFQGVPYAAPPVGELRWRAPQPVAPWQGERSAAAPGAICMQGSGASEGASEDCLTLQVFAPKGAHGAPVMVWLHGGANFFGSSSASYYDGGSFARDGVVLVAANYRLGAFGFFAHPALSRAAVPGEGLANFALMDQIAALRWVERNVAAFGGDPKRVTVFGESAGGTDVLALLASPAARGLFARAIVESPGRAWDPLPSLRDAEAEGVRFAAAAGLAGGAAATPAALRAIPAQRLLDVKQGDFLPTLDGTVMTESPAAAFAHGRAAHVPLIVGSNSYEASLAGDAAAMVQEHSAETRAAYAGEGATPEALGEALFADKWFTAPVRWYARRAAAAAPTWLYYFSYVRSSQRGKVPGAPHGSEIPYVFDSWDRISRRAALLPAEDRAMTAVVHGLWVSFATTGVPSSPQLPPWPAYTAERDELMDLGIKPALRAHFRQRQLDAQERAAAATLPAAAH